MLGRDGGVFGFPGPGLPPGGTPHLTVTPILSGLSIPWDLGFLPDGSMLSPNARARSARSSNGAPRLLAAPNDVRVGGEGGMLGLAVDPDFANNRRIYTCFNTTGGDVKVVRVDASTPQSRPRRASARSSPASPRTRVAGTRAAGPRVGPDGFLWVGTGDAATGTNPQDVNSLGGKVLRVDRFTGAAAPGNPCGFRWYTRGHRNVQGLAFRPGDRRALLDRARHEPRRRSSISSSRAGTTDGTPCPDTTRASR